MNDEIKPVSLGVDNTTLKHVCITSIDSNYTIEDADAGRPR